MGLMASGIQFELDRNLDYQNLISLSNQNYQRAVVNFKDNEATPPRTAVAVKEKYDEIMEALVVTGKPGLTKQAELQVAFEAQNKNTTLDLDLVRSCKPNIAVQCRYCKYKDYPKPVFNGPDLKPADFSTSMLTTLYVPYAAQNDGVPDGGPNAAHNRLGPVIGEVDEAPAEDDTYPKNRAKERRYFSANDNKVYDRTKVNTLTYHMTK
jgi:hypothetical protein